MGRQAFVLLLVLTAAAHGQELPGAPVANAAVSNEEWPTFAVVGAEILADGVTTGVLYQRHYNEIDPLAKPFVQAGVPGQIGGGLLGAGAMGGFWFVLRRTHHERTARWFLRAVAVGEGGNVVRQFEILRTSRK